MEIRFHCDQDHNFPDSQRLVRGVCYKDYEIEPHTHEFYEINIVMQGRGTHCIGECRVPVKTGDVFMIPPMTVHAYCDTDGLDVYHLLLHSNFVAQNGQEAETVPGYVHFMEIEPFLRSNDASLFLHLSGSQLVQLRTQLQFLDDLSPYDHRLKHHTAWQIVYWLSWLLAQQLEQKKPQNKYEASILDAMQYIHTHYGEKLTNEILCKAAYLSRSTFLRNFEAICGCTPAAYIRAYRSRKAVQMMQETTLSRTEIAHACGFYDLSHMQRSVKQERGTIKGKEQNL